MKKYNIIPNIKLMKVLYYKMIGESMQDIINRFKIEYNLEPNEKVAFAGRLDPIAHGNVIMLTGDDKKYMDMMCSHDKIYTYSVIESFKTDTYDIMGMILEKDTPYIENIISTETHICQPYPVYSSKTININGKMVRLWDAAKNNIIEKHHMIPTKEITIYYNIKKNSETITGINLLALINDRINKVQGDFRQKEILEKWNNIIEHDMIYNINHYMTKISSGGYVRSIANMMGSIAYDICRISYD